MKKIITSGPDDFWTVQKEVQEVDLQNEGIYHLNLTSKAFSRS